jgi:hypothetical protein
VGDAQQEPAQGVAESPASCADAVTSGPAAAEHHARKNGKLSEEAVARLNEIGFTWVAREITMTWTNFLASYKEECGHCWVPQRAVCVVGSTVETGSTVKARPLLPVPPPFFRDV